MVPPDEERGITDFETVLRSVDPRQPLNGEKPVAEAAIDETLMWVQVYREVVAMEERVLHAIESQLPHLSEWARTEAEATNVPLIRGQLDRFRHRLTLWEQRQRQLQGG